MGKLGSVTALGAEAGLWIAGAALIAGAAGMHWSVNLPSMDLSGLTGSKSSPAASHSTVAAGSPTPSATPATAVALFQAYASNPRRQYSLSISAVLTYNNPGATAKVTVTGVAAGSGNDCSESLTVPAASGSSTSDVVLAGSSSYARSGGGAWSKKDRGPNLKCEEMGLFGYESLVDKGIELKNGLTVHRLEVADPVQFGSYWEKLEKPATGQTATQASMIVWVGDDGSPFAFEITGSYNQTINGTVTPVTFTFDYAVIATSGVTIAAPI